MAEEFYAYSGGVWRKANALWVYNGGTWRPLIEAYVYDGSAWRRVFNSVVAPTLNSASGLAIFPFEWDLSYTLSSTAPTGYTLSVKQSGFLEAGPFSVAGTSSGNITIYTDSTTSYDVQLVDDIGTFIGSIFIFTPT